MRKKIISLFILITMVMSNITVSAAPVDDSDNTSGDITSGGHAAGSTWAEKQSGYRITVVNNKKEVVATTVDFLFSEPVQGFGKDNKYFYTNSRFNTLSNDATKWTYTTFAQLKDSGQILKKPQYPIYELDGKSGALYAGGEEFKQWFLNGKFGMDITNVNRKPTYTDSAEKKVETGTTRPVSTSPNYQPSGTNSTEYRKNTDMSGGYNGGIMVNDAGVRASKLSTARAILNTQGYRESADKTVASIVSAARGKWNNDAKKVTSGNYYNLLKEIGTLIQLQAGYYGRTVAEQNYLAASALNAFFGTSKTPRTTELRFRPTSSTDIFLDRIPASKAISPEYYVDEIMNSSVKGKFLFQFNGKGIANMSGVNSTKEPLEVIQENNFYMIVEPVFWLRPAKHSGGRKTNEQSHYVYGTFNNFVDYYKSKGWSTGGHYWTLTNVVGWSSMYMGNDWLDESNNTILKGVKLGSGIRLGAYTTNELKTYLDANYAIGTHVYRTTPEDMQVTGFSNWDTPDRAPDPKGLRVSSGWDLDYNIVKYYEEIEDGKLTHRYEPLYRSDNPPKIDIVDELYYKVKDWFVSASDIQSGAPATYDSAKSKYRGGGRTGKSPKSIKLEDDKNSNPGYKKELTLFVKLVSDGVSNDAPSNGNIVLNESEISKRVTTSDTSITGWGFKSFLLPKLSKTSLVVENTIELDKKLQGESGKFAPVLKNNKASGGKTLDKLEYITTIWRGNDIPTISTYKASGGDILKLVPRKGHTPYKDKGRNGSYTRDFKIALSPQNTPGLTEEEKANVSSLDYSSKVFVKVYGGANAKLKGEEYDGNAEKTELKITISGSQSNYTTGKMFQGDTLLQFYPYIRMTYQDTESNTKKDTYVTSQYYSSVRPNDYAEVGWHSPSMGNNMKVESTQWSLHKKAVDNGQSWNGANQVLPGGAIYSVTPSTDTIISLATWQTIMVGAERTNLDPEIPPNEYTLVRANAAHEDFINGAKDTLDNLEVVQWVNADPNAQFAWTNNGKRVKVTGGGVDLSPLGLNGKTSTDSKYYLNPASGDDSANKADLDIVGTNANTDVYYKVFSDTSGNIYMAKAVGNLPALQKVSGTKLTEPGVTVEKLFDKTVKAENARAALTGDAKELNDRTLLVTNFMKALERNTGNDKTASWASTDGKWYNEAWDGIYVVKKQTNISIGFTEPKTRTMALDPALTPKSNGKADLFTKAFVTQYRVEDTSSSEVARAQGAGYISMFNGTPIRLMNMGDIFVSKKFYIPNALVTDSY